MKWTSLLPMAALDTLAGVSPSLFSSASGPSHQTMLTLLAVLPAASAAALIVARRVTAFPEPEVPSARRG